MKQRVTGAVLAAAALFATGAAAFEVEEAEYRFLSDLAADGYTPVGAGASGNVLLGMVKEAEIYLCFLYDTPESQEARVTVMLDELDGKDVDRTVPKIPVVCLMTQ